MAVSSGSQRQQIKLSKMLRTKRYVSSKRIWQNPRESLMKQIINLYDKEFKAIVIKMLTELGRKIDEHNDSFNK